VDGFFEWQTTNGRKQPYAIAMKDGSPFGLAGLWENWKDPGTGEWLRTFVIITVPSNDLVCRIHDRMPAILHAQDCERWLGPEADPSVGSSSTCRRKRRLRRLDTAIVGFAGSQSPGQVRTLMCKHDQSPLGLLVMSPLTSDQAVGNAARKSGHGFLFVEKPEPSVLEYQTVELGGRD
jgi:hypothetical protein